MRYSLVGPKQSVVFRRVSARPYISWGHLSFDAAAAYAVRGIRDYWDISRPGVITITTEKDERSGRTISRTHHEADPAGLHRFLIKKKPDKEMSAIIDRMMAVPPKLAPYRSRR